MIALTTWTAFATVAFVVTAWFASTALAPTPGDQAAYEIQSRLNVSFANTITILRVIQAITSWATTSAVAASFEIAMWALASSETGFRILTLLILSPTTGPFGIAKLMCSRTTTWATGAGGLARLFLFIATTIGSVILFINTSVITSYYPIDVFDVLAGTGPFNGSLVGPFLRDFNTTIPYFALASSYSFIYNPQFSVSLKPSSCAGAMIPCDSYILPGGTYLMWPQLNSTVPDGSVISIESAPAMRIDFAEGLSSQDNFFSSADCAVFGKDRVGLQFCLSDSAVHHESLKAGIYLCKGGIQNGQCLVGESGSAHNVTMTFSVSSYTASSINGAENNTILSVSTLTTKEAKSRPDVQALSLAVGWLLNYTAANLPVQSSVAFGFWIAGSDAYQTFWKADAYRMLKSIIAFILWEFTANNNGNPAVANAEPSGQTPDLPAEFHVMASISRPFTRFIINRAPYTAYIVLQSVALISCWIVVLWGFMIYRRMSATTLIPLVDFGVKLRRMRSYDERPFSDIRTGDTEKRIRHVLQGVRVTSRCKERPEDVSLQPAKPGTKRRASWT
ncbi:hypothetical protein B0T10DRAFT_518691 [Thelonectria olida]|uniref:Uncharacterized protein n=1 Tax=Thelonectria olida TaxID=1576542 RepID=A0A9P9ANW6_9HYPO|nr:hypothetical protein B0T10DRAFT_518691 [Thelonectria olida]